jgi:hypothetical protein
MNIGTLKLAIAGYLEKDASSFVVNGVDLLLFALNNARKNAEKLHDFSFLYKYGKLLIPSGEDGSTFASVTTVGGTAVKCKKVIRAYRRIAGGDLPLRITPKKLLSDIKRMNLDDAVYDAAHARVLADYERAQGVEFSNRVILNGQSVYFHPAPTEQIELRLDYVAWADTYDADTDEDFFCEYAADYLMYQGIVEANHLTGTFAYRQEGNVQPPEKLANAALQSLIEQDKDLETSDTPELF